MKIYTKKGDNGKTSTVSGKIVAKYDEKIEAGGSVDEVNTALSMALIKVSDDKVKNILSKLSHLMFNLGATITNNYDSQNIKDFEISLKHISLLESYIDGLDKDLMPLKNFILPQGTEGAVFLHHARSIARRAERKIAALSEKEKINPNVLVFINRVSDLLFVMARYENLNAGGDVLWQQNIF